MMTMEKVLHYEYSSGPKKVRHHRHHHKLKHRFQFEKTLGKGTYGKVKLATEIETGKKVAIKTIPKSKIEDPEDLKRIRQEIELMSSLVHPHIIAIHEVFESKDKIVLVMEYACGGELYDYVDKQDITEEEARRIFRQIVSAVAFCHMNNVVHRDLKLENILLDEHNNIKIGDFGLSSRYDDNKLLSTFCGSPLYASPEIVIGKPYHGPEIDCWSLGVLLYALVYRTMPFKEDAFVKLRQHITTGEYQDVPFHSDAESLIRQLLSVNPRHRATIEDVMMHEWLCNEYSPRSAFPLLNFDFSSSLPKTKTPSKSILKNSRKSCDSGVNMSGSALESAHSDYSYNSSDLETEISGCSTRSGSKVSLLKSILKPKEKKEDIENASSFTSSETHSKVHCHENNNSMQVFKVTHHEETEHYMASLTVVDNPNENGNAVCHRTPSDPLKHLKETKKTEDSLRLRPNSLHVHGDLDQRSEPVVLRRKQGDNSSDESVALRNRQKNRDSVRLSKRMSCGKYSRIAQQWERLCKLNRQDSPVVLRDVKNRNGKHKDRDSSSSGEDTNVLEILSTPVLKKDFSFDFEKSRDSLQEDEGVSGACIVNMKSGSVAAARSKFESREVAEMKSVYAKALQISASLDK